MQENGMSLSAIDIESLAYALIDDELDENDEYVNELNIDQLCSALVKHEGWIDNLTIGYLF